MAWNERALVSCYSPMPGTSLISTETLHKQQIYCSSLKTIVENWLDIQTKYSNIWLRNYATILDITISILYCHIRPKVYCETYIKLNISSETLFWVMFKSFKTPVSRLLTKLNDDHKHNTQLWAPLHLTTKIIRTDFHCFYALAMNWNEGIKKCFAQPEALLMLADYRTKAIFLLWCLLRESHWIIYTQFLFVSRSSAK